MAHKLTNQTPAVIAARLSDGWVVVQPGDSVSYDDPRQALMAAEYGLTLEDREAAVKAEAADVPVTEGETNHTGGRQHRQDEPRTLPAGTPVEQTGDPGSTVPDEILTSTGAEALNPTPAEEIDPDGTDDVTGTEQVADVNAVVHETTTGETIVEPTVGVPGVPAGEAFDVDRASVAELKGYVEANGIEVTGTGEQGRVVKTDLIAAIKAARGDA